MQRALPRIPDGLFQHLSLRRHSRCASRILFMNQAPGLANPPATLSSSSAVISRPFLLVLLASSSFLLLFVMFAPSLLLQRRDHPIAGAVTLAQGISSHCE